jgi:hypothetical protein
MKIIERLKNFVRVKNEKQLCLSGKMLSHSLRSRHAVSSIHDVEFSIFSQWGDDGIIQWLTQNIGFPNHTFIEFGVEDYRESNTRFLMMNNNWTGLVMDGSDSNIKAIESSEYFWKHELHAKAAFITKENINELLALYNFHEDVGVLHIDIDGNDYWVWKEISVISPIVVIVEYNSVFGNERAITIPYNPSFKRSEAHNSCLYAGASLPALHELAKSKGYLFIGCNSAGNNAYFLRKDMSNDSVKEISLDSGYVHSKFRESRDSDGRLNFLSNEARQEAISGLPVFNTVTNEIEKI